MVYGHWYAKITLRELLKHIKAERRREQRHERRKKWPASKNPASIHSASTKSSPTMGRPWHPAPQYPGGGPIARKALQNMSPVPNRTAASKIYWAASPARQDAKREADVPYDPPSWLGARKRPRKKRQWIPGEHKR